MMKDGLGFQETVPRPLLRPAGSRRSTGALGASALGSVKLSYAVRKSTLERYDFNRKDCFRAQTPLNCSDRQATIGRDRRDSDGMR